MNGYTQDFRKHLLRETEEFLSRHLSELSMTASKTHSTGFHAIDVWGNHQSPGQKIVADRVHLIRADAGLPHHDVPSGRIIQASARLSAGSRSW